MQKFKKIDLDLKIKWLFVFVLFFLTQHNVLILGENTRLQSAGYFFFFVRIICRKQRSQCAKAVNDHLTHSY